MWKEIEKKLRIIEKSQSTEERLELLIEINDLIIQNLNKPQFREKTLSRIRPYLRKFIEQMDAIKNGAADSFYYEKIFQAGLFKITHLTGDEGLISAYRDRINLEELETALKEMVWQYDLFGMRKDKNELEKFGTMLEELGWKYQELKDKIGG